MAMSDAPSLAVVGHPNKGKSSLVATLSQDDSVAIGANPGTTSRSRSYPMRVDGRLLYSLVDTPGFQRARQVLGWLEERARIEGASAMDRARLVADFVHRPEHASRFPDECELLRPIVEGAGILYVVDGGVPYGPEYEAEMEILRWTGAPSMAIINPIGSAAHVEAWRSALTQFFRVVRVIDAVAADYTTRRQLLLAFGELEADWREPIDRAVAALDSARESQRKNAAREIAEMIASSLGHVTEKRVATDEDSTQYREALEAEYKKSQERIEADHRRSVQRT
jgi:GTP1/Obg family GTP-binding protein